MPDINIGSKLDAKGFKQAETALSKLSNNAKKAAKALTAAFGVSSVASFAKSSVKAFMDSEREAALLSNTVKNLGLAFDQPSIDIYIDKIGKLYGVTGDQAVPALQALLSATGSVTKSTSIFDTALNIAATTGAEVSAVAKDLSQAYLGNTKALNKYDTGLTKAELAALDFNEIQNVLNKNFAGAASKAAGTYSGQMAILSEAANQAKEIIGKSLMDALTGLGEDDSVETLATNMQSVATYTGDVIAGVGVLIEKLKGLPAVGNFDVAMIPILGAWLEIFRGLGKAPLTPLDPKAMEEAMRKALERIKAEEAARKKAEEAAAKRAKELAALQKKSAADALKAAKLKLAVDKATLALGKGSDVFDLEKIQLAAAEKNQAQQLGKITSKDQLLQITNDLARLEVKKSILDLEEAIAKKDVAAITNATNKLNADLKVLGALTGQKVKLTEIDDILKAILPKDLINIKNLDEAIAKLIAIGKTVVSPIVSPTGTPTGTATAKTLTPAEIEALLILGRTVPIVPDSSGTIGYSGNAGNYPSSGFPGSAMGYGGSANTYNITVQAGIGDPNAIAEAIDQVLTDAAQRGTLRSLAVA
jgi:hypothetical protein